MKLLLGPFGFFDWGGVVVGVILLGCILSPLFIKHQVTLAISGLAILVWLFLAIMIGGIGV